MGTEWFRNKEWNAEIASSFNERLGRARRKEQYLRIQASTLANTHPTVSLELLDRYFELPDDFDHAQAHVDRATALLTLGRTDEAIEAYEAALTREAAFPKLLTGAYLEMPFLVAVGKIRNMYERSLELLEAHEDRLMFPVDHFRWHAAKALIAADSQLSEVATRHANQALEAASAQQSGFRYHSSVGLVKEDYDKVIKVLAAQLAA